MNNFMIGFLIFFLFRLIFGERFVISVGFGEEKRDLFSDIEVSK